MQLVLVLVECFLHLSGLCAACAGPDPAAGVTRHSQGCLKGGERREGWRGGQTDCFFKSQSQFQLLTERRFHWCQDIRLSDS